MPGLESFCVCTAIGLGSIYLLQISWFVAWLVLDEQRVSTQSNALLPCVRHKDYKPDLYRDSTCLFVRKYSSLLSSSLYKFIILLIACCLFATGIWGSILIKQKFEPQLLLPSNSYLRKFLSSHNFYFPQQGWTANIYTGPIDNTDLESIEELTNQLTWLEKNQTYLGDVDCWWSQLKKYAKEKTNFTNWEDFATEEYFPMVFSDFLFSSHGSRFKPNFKFDGELKCNHPAPPINASMFSIDYLIFSGPEEHIPAKKKIEELVKSSNISTAFSHVQVYAAWETDEIIGSELWRNIGLAMACVFLITLILLANVPVCLMVLLIVVMTLIDIIGFLHFWNITIDIISCINIVLAIGLCVDYSVHVGHAFIVATGNRQEKVEDALIKIGPAVLNGGITTFLALVLLGASTSHIFVTFFKVFVLTVLFGLFHGLVFLPVLLSLVGPVENLESQSLPKSDLNTSSKPIKEAELPQDTSDTRKNIDTNMVTNVNKLRSSQG